MRKALAFAAVATLACSNGRTASTSPEVAAAAEPKPAPSFWGPAPSLAKRIEVFEAVADDLEATYVFEAANFNWETTRPLLRARIESVETFAEFARVFSDLSRGLGDNHNSFVTTRVCKTPLTKRPPFLRGFMGSMGDRPSTLGFCGTALDDDSVLVYRVHEENAAALKPGDRIVGFDGKGLRPLLTEALATLPYCGSTAGSGKSDDLLMITSMAYNPHLYRKMDVVRGGKKEIESIETERLLATKLPMLACNEQLATAIPFPWASPADAMKRSPVSSGILPGTNIGYIYVYGWVGDVKDSFLAAVTSLQGTGGLIIDTRLNIGGNMFASYPTLRLLFKEDITDRKHVAVRAVPPNRELRILSEPYAVKVDSTTFYDHPIALLTGPLAGSSGDGVTYLLAAHPRARRFGRPTNGSGCYSGRGTSHRLGLTGGLLKVRRTPCISLDRDKKPINGSAVEPEISVWLTPEDVTAGRDTVVQTALEWIAKENATPAGRP